MKYSESNFILNNWSELDGLRNDECIKAFEINCKIENSFKAIKASEKKLATERDEIIKKVSALDQVEKIERPDGQVFFENIPDKTKAKITAIDEELRELADKEKKVDFEALTKEDLDKHDMLNGKILRLFGPIIDLSKKEEPKKD